MNLYLIANGAAPGAAAVSSVTTGTAIKTMLQLKAAPNAGGLVGVSEIKIKEWGISFDGSAAATPIKVELVETNTPATVTAFSTLDVVKFGNYYSPFPPITLSTTGTGYTATNEGSPTDSRLFDLQLIAPTNQYVKQYPLGEEPRLGKWATSALRVRVTAAAAVNAYTYILFES